MPEREPGEGAEPRAFGKYFLTEKLATGGMAEIYLAKILGPGGFEKPLVIKQIHPRLSGQRQFVDLFVAEAKTLVSLAHGNIVPVYELGVIDDTYFIAMEYIDGPTLYRLTETLRRREVAMAPPVAAWITARILEGLAYAHRKGEGVIHRDLSPRNVMMSRDGEVKLVDFGIAVTLGGAGEDDAGQSAPTGSFPYMSPEQVRKQPLTGQSDLFSVGVLFWEMLVGRRLFARPDPDATLRAVLSGDIARPSSLDAGVPARLDEVVMRALERDVAARWANADDMLAALQRYLYSLDETPGPRDIAALVARYCPPETRRLPTHSDGEIGEAARSRRASSISDDTRRTGPATAIVPRSPRARTETFATHVVLDELLRGEPAPAAARGDATPAIARPVAKPTDDPPPPERRAEVPGRAAPPTALLFIGALGAIGLGGATLFVFFQGRDAALRPDAGVPPRPIDAGAPIADADAAPPIVDAAPAPPAAPDARVAEVRPPPHRPEPPPDAAIADPAAARGTASLTIGANPWGVVVLDGKTIGHTPIEKLTVAAGHHVVKVTFSGEDPPRTLSYNLDLATGDSKDVVADFTKP
jgi:serine/threonine protein kinase